MYEFDDLPLSPIAPATNVLVTGPAMSGVRGLFLRMLVPQPGTGEGAIVVTTGTDADSLRSELASAGEAVEGARIGIVDCVSQQQGTAVEGEYVRMVSSPRDLTGIGMELTDLYETFYSLDVRQIRTGLDSISTLLMYAELATVFRFLHVATGRVASGDGLGVFVIDPSSHDEQTTQTLSQLFDGRIDVREGDDGDPELRVRGLPDQPDGWQPL